MFASFTIDLMESTTGWSLLNDETSTLATTTTCIDGDHALSFAKVTGDTKLAGISRTMSPSADMGSPAARWRFQDRICWLVNVSDLTDVDYTFVRLGTDASNYCEWRFPDTSLTAGRFTLCSAKIGDAYVVGNGWDSAEVTYLVVGVAFDNNTDALAGIVIDHVSAESVDRVET